MEQHARVDCKPSTADSYSVQIRHHLKSLAHIALRDLRKTHVLDWKGAQLALGERSSASVRYSLNVLKGALKKAIDWNLVEVNAAQGVKVKIFDKDRFEAKPFNREEVRQLLAGTKEDRYQALWATAVATGARQGELLSLRWEDVDLERKVVRIRYTLARVKGKGLVLQSPKTRRSKRDVYLQGFAVESLQRHKEEQEFQKSIAAYWDNRGFIFTTKDGSPCDGANIWRAYTDACKEAGLRKTRFHDLRHSCATMALMSGANMKTISEQLGHTSILMTADRYGHVLEESRRDVAARLESFIGPETKTEPQTEQNAEIAPIAGVSATPQLRL